MVHTLALPGKTLGGGLSTFSEMLQNHWSGFMSTVEYSQTYSTSVWNTELDCKPFTDLLVLVLHRYFGDFVCVL